ncbi:enoyl-CoA hydratase/isomerase family protein [Kibdelosporangium philippinense]|uniref:Enoyl-CoA hydratase/isomerase family protein n=1 Tax=Kibdelosporangium philippinense TaxID=211113 RepID=A0ABS8Z6V6_9PSEU|nr:enoyl-CoA hydratase/isomerase family protein [Kibdelosporangium philippinense]MCE7002530.1 enoyl-CoA hydratase/isomerase family protein [Kibdelosporangium philippinense]
MATSHIKVDQPAPGYVRATFDHAPINLIDYDTVSALIDLVTRLEQDPDVRVVVFDSANPDYFLAHWDTSAFGRKYPAGTHPWLDVLNRLSRLPVATIAAINGRARGAGSEFVLACDMRFAARDHARLGQPEVAFGLVPAGGPMARLPRLLGRGRALEIVLSGHDFTGAQAELYGYVNRALPDAELDEFVDTLARRIARFDKRAIAEIKEFVDVASNPDDAEIWPMIDAFQASAVRPSTAARVTEMERRGLGQAGHVEFDLGVHCAADDLPTTH